MEKKNEDFNHSCFVPVEGTVMNWDARVQVNPETGETFGLDGCKLFTEETGSGQSVTMVMLAQRVQRKHEDRSK